MVNAPLPMVIFRPENDEVIWSNDRFLQITGERDHLFDTKISAAVPDFSSRWLMEGKTECPTEVRIGDRRFLVYGHLVRTEEQGARGYLATTYNIWKSLQKVPAGTMFVPLIIGAIITTICQGFFHFDLWETLGNPMKDMFSSSGQMLLIGLMLFCTGTSLKLSDMADALHRGVILIATRLIVAYLLSALYYLAFGYEGILGISFLAFVCAVSSANAALYMGIIQPFGDKADKASFGIMLICSMPLLPLLFLGFFGTSGFGLPQIIQIISLLIPFILGMILGNLDEDIRKVFAGGNAIILPFLGFEFGNAFFNKFWIKKIIIIKVMRIQNLRQPEFLDIYFNQLFTAPCVQTGITEMFQISLVSDACVDG